MGHAVISIALEIYIFWNYAVTVLTPPGSPMQVEYGAGADVGRSKRLASFSLCRRCQVPRPPRAHHCSVCGVCAYDLDHHCVFVNNCVGYENRRNFCLFLIFACVGCAYAIYVFFAALWWNAGPLIYYAFPLCVPANIRNVLVTLAPEVTSMHVGSFGRCARHTSTVLLTIYLMASLIVELCVGCLLVGQLQLLARGTTQLEYWKGRASEISASSHLELLTSYARNIFSMVGPPSSWLLLRRGPITPECGGPPRPLVASAMVAVEKCGEVVEGKKLQ